MSDLTILQVPPTAYYELKDDNGVQLVVVVMDKNQALDRSVRHYRQLREHWFIAPGADLAALASGSSGDLRFVAAAVDKSDVEARLDQPGVEAGLSLQLRARTALSLHDWTEPPRQTRAPKLDSFVAFQHEEPTGLWLALRFDVSARRLTQVIWYAPPGKSPAVFAKKPTQGQETKFLQKPTSQVPSDYHYFDEHC
ncbi:MAG: hypothetical protein AAGE52_03480 [Myxococcota bacterium]